MDEELSHSDNTMDQNNDRLIAMNKNGHDKRRLPRTSNGPSLASLIALAKVSDFDPDPPSSTPYPLELALKDVGLRHSSEGPSLAALIASADPADFPLPDSDSESDLESEVYETEDFGDTLVRRHNYLHQFASTVLRKRFEARHECGDGAAAREWMKKKKKNHAIGGESLLRLEIQLNDEGEDLVSVTVYLLKCSLRFRAQRANSMA